MQFTKDIQIIWQFLTDFKKKLFFICSVAVVGSIITAGIPYLYGRLVDIALIPGNSIWLIFSLVAVWFLLSLLSDWTNRYANNVGELFTYDIVNHFNYRVLAHTIELPFSFHDNKKKGKLIAQVSRAGDYVYMIVSGLFYVLPGLLTVVIALILLLKINIILALILLLILFFYTVISIKESQSINKIHLKLDRAWEKVYGDMYESIMNIDVVKNNANEDYEKSKFKKGQIRFKNVFQEFSFLWRRLDAWQQTIFTIGFVALFGLAVFLMRGGVITPGNLVTFVGYIALVFQPFAQLANRYRIFQKGLPSIKRAVELMKMNTEKYWPEGGVDLKNLRGEIEFRNVYFTYHSDREVFSGISFKIKPGETVALVGTSGSGKSSLVNLLQGYYIPQRGQILVDGQDIKKFNLKSFRAKIAVVPQEVTLFNESVKHNIKYGNLRASDRAIIAAAREANAHEFIQDFKYKYKQLVGERGVKLSVGQKQRIAIARAILRDPSLLILDEATSSLDSKTEKLVHDALRRLIQGRTSIIIAHRFSTIAFVDRIIVLKKGKIVEEGMHATLMRRKGEYYRLYTEQVRGLDKNFEA